MNWKKFSVFNILLLLAIMPLTMNLVTAQSAAGDAVVKAIDTIEKVANPIFKWIVGPSTTGEDFIVRILAFFLVMVIVYGVFETINIFRGKRWINFIIGLIISLIGIRALPANFILQMTNPASAFVLVIVFGVPFVALFFLLRGATSPIRRATWAIFGVLILALWAYNWGTGQAGSSFWWVYPLFGLGCLLAFMFDATFQKVMGRANKERLLEHIDQGRRARLYSQIETLEALADAETDSGKKAKYERDIVAMKKTFKSMGP